MISQGLRLAYRVFSLYEQENSRSQIFVRASENKEKMRKIIQLKFIMGILFFVLFFDESERKNADEKSFF